MVGKFLFKSHPCDYLDYSFVLGASLHSTFVLMLVHIQKHMIPLFADLLSLGKTFGLMCNIRIEPFCVENSIILYRGTFPLFLICGPAAYKCKHYTYRLNLNGLTA